MQEFLKLLKQNPKAINFEDTMIVIERYYNFKPTAFTNGSEKNKAGENNGSCKLFAFAKLQGLNQQQTLDCFGQYYRDDVLHTPEGSDHQNIRNFMKTAWSTLEFNKQPLTLK